MGYLASLAFALFVAEELGQVSEGKTGYSVLRTTMFLVASVGLLHVLAQVKEQAVEARDAAQMMSVLANTDALTGVPNRRQLHTVVEVQRKQADTDGSSLAVILLDVDHFKRVNDTLGHEVGASTWQTEGQQRSWP